jgi:ABC-type uncharacterized transport system, periplasmic component
MISPPLKTAAIAVLLLASPCFRAYAHPHVFIASHVAVELRSASVARINVEWSFDELFSQMVAADYDRGKKGYFTESEATALKKGAFDNLRNYHYFLALFVDKQPRALPQPADFKPSMKNGNLVYSFDLPLGDPIPRDGAELRLTIYDDTYYVAFDKLKASDIEVIGDGSAVATISIEKTKVKAEWPGQFMPDQICIRLGKAGK